MSYSEDTIAAAITPPGMAGVALVRLSGSHVRGMLTKLVSPEACAKILALPRTLIHCGIGFQPFADEDKWLDQGMVAFFPAPHSFTGEDVLEFNLHGSPYLVQEFLKLCLQSGARLAEPGEFSRRAYENGKMDLLQAEAVADLIAAESAAQAQVARDQLSGRLSRTIDDLGDPLREVLAEIEAYLDFPEEDIQPRVASGWQEGCQNVIETLDKYLATYSSGRIYREGARVVLAGLPNAGKSSLLNALLGEERVIVSSIPGTTRDSVEERISLNGFLVRLCDTAGIVGEKDETHTPDIIEKKGVDISWRRVMEADFLVLVYDPLESRSRQQLFFEKFRSWNKPYIVAVNKKDLLTDIELQQLMGDLGGTQAKAVVPVSSLFNHGIKEIKAAFVEQIGAKRDSAQSVLISSLRHAQLLASARDCLARALRALDEKRAPEVVALEIRESLRELQDIVGVTTADDVLGLVFSKFCIGK